MVNAKVSEILSCLGCLFSRSIVARTEIPLYFEDIVFYLGDARTYSFNVRCFTLYESYHVLLRILQFSTIIWLFYYLNDYFSSSYPSFISFQPNHVISEDGISFNFFMF